MPDSCPVGACLWLEVVASKLAIETVQSSNLGDNKIAVHSSPS